MSAKAKGKQRSFEDEGTIPDAQMSGLRLGIDQLLPLQLGDEWRRSHSRNSTTESVYLEDNDVSTGRRSKNATSHSSRTSRSRNTPSRFGKRSVISEDEEDESAMDHALPDSDTKPSGKKRKVNRYPCPVPLCKETFTRRNDVRRHIKNAAVHRDSPEALALLGEAVVTGTRCKYCNADLSRADARMRHERASACGKRTTQKMKDQMLLMKA
ncbi:hypothetical protein BDP27DRAFT_285741 [Rhodocollybia butyracea]|uniref:C2H2-type domain-containing protein n=1 Tax=Rhodocollybia butyracea TaxID=206335 RepID=A0A9P5Q2G8_9AGAR|nr:hypothetical protein BDP27DRAFT_285741 [Rhodocollybia butyracea]